MFDISLEMSYVMSLNVCEDVILDTCSLLTNSNLKSQIRQHVDASI